MVLLKEKIIKHSILISVIVVVRNECDYIIDCIKSIEEQFSENDNWELIIIDGISEDDTKFKAQNYLESQTYNWKIIDNPEKTLASGWNLGIKSARGDFVCRPDAHGILHKDYIKKGIELHSKIDAVAIGGILETKSKTFMGNIIKEALSSKIGVGSSFRTMKKSEFTDTAVYAVYKKSIFEKVGYFDETLIRHQDNDMHKRIKQIGGKFYTSTEMIADYYCRDNIKKLLKQMYNIGLFLPDVFDYKSISVRHLIPLFFFLGNILGILLLLNGYFIGNFYIGIMVLYLILIIFEMSKRFVETKDMGVYLNLIIIPLMHFTYGFGTFIGIFKKMKLIVRNSLK